MDAIAQVQLRSCCFIEDCLGHALTVPTAEQQMTGNTVGRRRRKCLWRTGDGCGHGRTETWRQAISDRHCERIGIRIRSEFGQMTARWTKLTRIVDDLNQIAFAQSGYLIAAQTCERKRPSIRTNRSHANAERGVIARPFETSHAAGHGRIPRSCETIEETATERYRTTILGNGAERRALELAVVGCNDHETGTPARARASQHHFPGWSY